MAEWGIDKVTEIIMESIKDGTVDATNTENLIRIAYCYGYIDGKHKEDIKNMRKLSVAEAELRKTREF